MNHTSSLIDGSLAVLGGIAGVIAFVSALLASEAPGTSAAEVEAESGARKIRTSQKKAA